MQLGFRTVFILCQLPMAIKPQLSVMELASYGVDKPSMCSFLPTAK